MIHPRASLLQTKVILFRGRWRIFDVVWELPNTGLMCVYVHTHILVNICEMDTQH